MNPIRKWKKLKNEWESNMPEHTVATTTLPSLDEIRAAQDLVYSVMSPTSQIVWPLLCERLGTEIWVKHENHTPIGAFKARTAIVYGAELFREQQRHHRAGHCHARKSRRSLWPLAGSEFRRTS
jgi:hypothetical protein